MHRTRGAFFEEKTMYDFIKWLDDSDVAYLVMLALFLAMANLHSKAMEENTRLRKLLKKAMR
ncbi:MAG TPA: hypothetical protein DF614_01670 [Methylococcaceae bacterium]|nr:hypothetical protein [Methylococcaceae bacterium]